MGIVAQSGCIGGRFGVKFGHWMKWERAWGRLGAFGRRPGAQSGYKWGGGKMAGALARHPSQVLC